MDQLEQATNEFMKIVLESDVYKTYRAELEKVNQHPELKRQIDEYRRQNYLMQFKSDIDFDKIDRFEKDYETFREDPLVADFLAAELDLCRTMQRIFGRMTELLDFQ